MGTRLAGTDLKSWGSYVGFKPFGPQGEAVGLEVRGSVASLRWGAGGYGKFVFRPLLSVWMWFSFPFALYVVVAQLAFKKINII